MTEDVAVVGGATLALLHPVVSLAVFTAVLIVIWMIFPRLWRGIRATTWLMWNKVKMPGKRHPLEKPVELRRAVTQELADMLKIQANVDENHVVSTVRCLSGKSKGVKGLSPNLQGVLVLTERQDKVYFAASKGLSDRVFRLPLSEASVSVESKFLSENLVLATSLHRAVFRFPRGQSPVVETLCLRIAEMIASSQPLAASPSEELVEATPQTMEPELAVESSAPAPLPSIVGFTEPGAFAASRTEATEEEPKSSILPIPAIG